MKNILLILGILLLNSCFPFTKNGIEVKIENKSDFSIKNVKFYTSEKLSVLEFDEIKSNKSIADFLSMKKNKVDGDYILEFTRSNGKTELNDSGYYTNGFSGDKSVFFEIQNDTIIVTFDGNLD